MNKSFLGEDFGLRLQYSAVVWSFSRPRSLFTSPDFTFSIFFSAIISFCVVCSADKLMEANEKLLDFRVGSVPTLIYTPEFVTEAEETQLLNNIYQSPIFKWKTLKNRRLQNWGGVVHEKGLLSQDLPPWLAQLTQRIFDETKIFPAKPNHVLVNEYLPEQGIMPHQDGPAYFPAAAILSLGSPVVMDFTPHSILNQCHGISLCSNNHDSGDGEPVCLANHHRFSILLMPRSLLIFKDTAYSEYLHGIEESMVQHYDRAVNLTEAVRDHELDSLLPDSVTTVEGRTTSREVRYFHRTSNRVSLTCRLVLKVHKNLIKV
ncbi:hypothetical protein Nepgr_003040 [Nepenthes gracilis]|uniref:Fe2OG dioxygenase domain-containing protein n=1 Tax=Nepenthes gracilis TaxID=150966 RepID=A0AAD3XD90_NEPGR|nr:hypothetical protein Nepgr_003040 [Nepenthes gracilis]